MKTLVLMQGVPGSGKSTVAKMIQEDVTSGGAYPEYCEILSTDDYWMRDGEYVFRPAELAYAHEWNQARARLAMREGVGTIIIDNTNIKRDHVLPYLAAAAEHGYDIQVVRVTVDPALAMQRNTHNVPAEAIFRMHQEMEDLL